MLPLTNWSISDGTLIRVATSMAPFWITVTFLSTTVNFMIIAVTVKSTVLRTTCYCLTFFDAWAFSQAVSNVAVIVVYSKLKHVLKSKRLPSQSDTRKIFRSLYTIVLCYLLGWVATIPLLIVIRLLTNDINLTSAVELAISVFAAINLIIPFFVYVTQSSMYKQEICRLFGFPHKVAPAPATGSQLSGTAPKHQL